MGAGSWSPHDFVTRTATLKDAPVGKVFTSTGMKDELDPKRIKVRESRDSTEHPKSTPMIFACDVTGSMGEYARMIAVDSLGTLFKEILDRKPISDPQLMFMGVGDAHYDIAPLQVSQFESDNRVLEQLTDIYFEKGGGGNMHESYTLPWYFAAHRTSTDAFEVRGKKGYLFTSGDERCPDILYATELEKVFGKGQYRDYKTEDLLELVSSMYQVFHIVIKESRNARMDYDGVMSSWRKYLGQRVIELEDHTKLAEVVVSIIQIIEGEDKDKVVKSWSGDTSIVVANSVKDLSIITRDTVDGLVRL